MTGTNEIRSIFSWSQTGVQAAYLGLKAYTKEILVRSAMANDERYRFRHFMDQTMITHPMTITCPS